MNLLFQRLLMANNPGETDCDTIIISIGKGGIYSQVLLTLDND